MSDLISRETVIDILKQTGIIQDNDIGHCVIEEINRIPMAYDIDKVVEELNELYVKAIKRYKNGNFGDYEGTDYYIKQSKAIEIVKRGGVSDDVCEWKSVSDGEFIKNPHTKRLYSNEPSMQNVYCNTCGKKIKVVE